MNISHFIYPIICIPLVVLLCTYYVMSIENYNSAIEIRETCKIVCENNNMAYEGIKSGLCACNPSLYVRVYLEPHEFDIDGRSVEEMQEVAGNPPFFNVTVNSSLGSSAKLRFSPLFYEKYKELY